ncbi:uncharacterized protein LACBIDRAFT_330314 [Laccaria bicolor S238N-H82]|uniref:Predicted protein n=1 Tax=Laccaria bicolor (strain S238N-H82 / ATCC MYA-4686) TaxID=486041 RepID=B0DKW5_LACBS|nr:uncharacterized protein LACBIDRAFT_330314 [Laccaria bicolor S238N-H82]EDR04810.1 predicted protein [Laccaria bicolor S238N-H82]|eukprot:XP_001884634.1 predicted protein [Laccaria bicolor S238N-H82]
MASKYLQMIGSCSKKSRTTARRHLREVGHNLGGKTFPSTQSTITKVYKTFALRLSPVIQKVIVNTLLIGEVYASIPRSLTYFAKVARLMGAPRRCCIFAIRYLLEAC